jgi:hypothetical protein
VPHPRGLLQPNHHGDTETRRNPNTIPVCRFPTFLGVSVVKSLTSHPVLENLVLEKRRNFEKANDPDLELELVLRRSFVLLH